jgi:hypothetical protein
MGRLKMLILALFVMVGFMASSAMATEVYLTDTSGTPITGMTITQGDDFTFDVRIKELPSGHDGLKFGYVKLNIGDPSQVSYEGFQSCGYTVIEKTDYGFGWAINLQPCPGPEPDTCLVRLTYHCEGAGTTVIAPTSYWVGTNPDFGMCDGTFFYDTDVTYAAGMTVTQEAATNQAPVCPNQSVSTFKNTPKDIILVATDDGLPAPPGALTYSIESLPSGSLKDSGNYTITVGDLPYTLPDNTVNYTPVADSCDSDLFIFKADDSVLSCAEGTVNIQVQCAVQMVMPRLWPCTPPYHWWFENPDQHSEGAQSAHPSMTATPNEEVCFYINYDAFDDNGDREKELSGISFWVSYDSDFLEISDPEKDIKHIFPKGYVNVLNAPEIICDDNNCKFLMAWADPSSPPAWPNEPLPLEILKVCFMVPESAQTDTSTMVTFSDDPHTAVGYGFYSEDMTVKIVDFNIDIDGNNDVEPLTDGLLITRYLFGFMGNNLVSGAVDPLGSRAIAGASEIADWIERGRVEPAPTDNGGYTHLDIDKNTEVTALTDGIMILRQLFGYTGANLTAGALGPNATRYVPGEIKTYIDTLKP